MSSFRFQLVCAILGALLLGFALGVGFSFPTQVQWDRATASDPTVPSGFSYLLFPRTANVPVVSDSGQLISYLERATITKQVELEADCCAIYLRDSEEGRVDAELLTAAPPKDADRYVTNLRYELRDWGWKQLAWQRTGETVSFRLTNMRRGWTEFRYSLGPDGEAQAEQWTSKGFFYVSFELLINKLLLVAGLCLVVFAGLSTFYKAAYAAEQT